MGIFRGVAGGRLFVGGDFCGRQHGFPKSCVPMLAARFCSQTLSPILKPMLGPASGSQLILGFDAYACSPCIVVARMCGQSTCMFRFSDPDVWTIHKCLYSRDPDVGTDNMQFSSQWPGHVDVCTSYNGFYCCGTDVWRNDVYLRACISWRCPSVCLLALISVFSCWNDFTVSRRASFIRYFDYQIVY